MVPPYLWRPEGAFHPRPILESVMYAFYLATRLHEKEHFYCIFIFLSEILERLTDTLLTIICNTPMDGNPDIPAISA